MNGCNINLDEGNKKLIVILLFVNNISMCMELLWMNFVLVIVFVMLKLYVVSLNFGFVLSVLLSIFMSILY